MNRLREHPRDGDRGRGGGVCVLPKGPLLCALGATASNPEHTATGNRGSGGRTPPPPHANIQCPEELGIERHVATLRKKKCSKVNGMRNCSPSSFF